MGRLRLLLASAIAFAAYAVVTAAPVAAETTIDPEGNVVKIKIGVDIFAGPDVRTGPNGEPLDAYWEDIVTRWWGEAFERLSYKNCYKLELDLDFRLRDINDQPDKGRHRVYVGTETRGWRGVGWDGTTETRADPRTGDDTGSYENDRKGDIPVNAPEMVVAHEFGHVMGLGDDRENGEAKNGRTGTVMVGGAKGVDPYLPYDPRMIDKNLVDRLGRVIEEALALDGKKLSRCETWNGKIDGTGENRGVANCADPSSHSGIFTIAITRGGNATLTGHMVNTGVCAAGRTETDFAMQGRKTRSQFSFPASATFPFDVDLRVQGDRASGSSTTNPGGDGIYFVTLNFTADCQTCDQEAA